MADLLTNTKIGTTTLAQGGTVTVTLPAIAGTLMVATSTQNAANGLLDYGLSGGGNGAYILCYNNARAQTIATATNTIVQVDTVVSNTNTAIFEQNGYGIQCKVAGLYAVDAMVAFATTGTTGRTGVSIFQNSTQYDFSFIPMRDNYDKAVGCTTLRLAANDIIYFGAYQNSGSNKSLAIGGYVSENRMTISKIA